MSRIVPASFFSSEGRGEKEDLIGESNGAAGEDIIRCWPLCGAQPLR